jgi:hypothetical protein
MAWAIVDPAIKVSECLTNLERQKSLFSKFSFIFDVESMLYKQEILQL